MSLGQHNDDAMSESSAGRPSRSVIGLLVGLALDAIVIFAWLLIIGAALAVAAKLQAPDIGAGASAASVFVTIVVVSLGSLGAPVAIGEVEIAVIPLGAVLAFGVVVVRVLATKTKASRDDVTRPRVRGVARNLLVTPLFASLCAVAAAVFRLGGEAPVHASPAQSALWGAVWCALFTVAGRTLQSIDGRALLGDLRVWTGRRVSRRSATVAAFAAGSAAQLGLAGSAAGLGLMVTIADSIGDGGAAAAGALLHDLAFFPNLVISLSALAVGAPVEAGTALTLAGEVPGLPDYSLWDWAGGPTPVLAWLLLAVPLVAGLATGAVARRASPSLVSAVRATLLAAVGFGVGHAALAWLGDARVAAGTIGEEGFARVAPEPLASGALALGWIAVIGVVAVIATDRLGAGKIDPSHPRTGNSNIE